jgi:hypothetical protein
MKQEFEQRKYQVIKNAISYELANFIFNYQLLRRDAVNFMYENNITADNGHYGTWTDQQVPNVYSEYGDHVMETLLMKVLPIMKEETGLDLVPTYSYTRVYEKGSILKKHKDRPSCEISTTLHLGGDPWSIFIDNTEITLGIGDMLVYSGCDLEHWREKFEGNICGQVFLHYNHVNGPFADKNIFDERPMLGLPKISYK